MQKMKEHYTIKKGHFSNCMHFARAGGGGREDSRVFSPFRAGRGNILGMSSTPEVSHGGDGRPSAAATCVSAEALLCRRFAPVRISLFRVVSILPPVGRVGGGGDKVAKLCPPSAARRSWFRSHVHTHTPSGAINQVARISLIFLSR